MVLVTISIPGVLNEGLPYSRTIIPGNHGVRNIVPSVEIPYYGYLNGIWSPDCEKGSFSSVIKGIRMGSQLFVEVEVASLLEKIYVMFCDECIFYHGHQLPQNSLIFLPFIDYGKDPLKGNIYPVRSV